MIKKYKMIYLVCVVAILCNIAVRFYLINEQANQVSILQNMVAAARSGNYLKSDKPLQKISTEQNDVKRILHKIPDELSFTEYAVKIRSLIDKNHLIIDGSLVFMPEKTKEAILLKYNTNIIVKGNYTKIKKLISDIQNMPGLVNFDSASIARENKTQDKVVLKLKLSVFLKKRSA
ncbi:MAG: type 4a pilus biogenesis protein PilO [Pseudomonadota bacterium]